METYLWKVCASQQPVCIQKIYFANTKFGFFWVEVKFHFLLERWEYQKTVPIIYHLFSYILKEAATFPAN